MMEFAEAPTLWQQLSAWWKRSRRMPDNVVQCRVCCAGAKSTKDDYRRLAWQRPPHTATYWHKLAEDHRKLMGNLDTPPKLRDYYENEARLCDAETAKTERAGTDGRPDQL